MTLEDCDHKTIASYCMFELATGRVETARY